MLLGQLLVQTGRITDADLANALRAQPTLGLRLGEILMRCDCRGHRRFGRAAGLVCASAPGPVAQRCCG